MPSRRQPQGSDAAILNHADEGEAEAASFSADQYFSRILAMPGTAGIESAAGPVDEALITGTDGDDVLDGGDGDDVIDGGEGNDILDGRGGNDVVYGGAGNDRITVSGGTNASNTFVDAAHGGAGTDHLVVNYGQLVDDVTFAAAPTYPDGASGTIRVAGLDRLTFTGIERITITTGSGNDIVYGIGNDDVISTGGGNDSIYSAPGAGPDRIDGGAGVDTAYDVDWSDLSADTSVSFDLNDGSMSGNVADGRYLRGIERLVNYVGGTGADQIVLGWGANAALSDSVSTGAGNDRVTTFAGTGAANTGTDTIAMGTGRDWLHINFSSSFEQITFAAPPTSHADGASGVVRINGIDKVIFSGVDVLWVTGGFADDIIYGTAGDDYLDGRSGHDLIYGGDGDDTIQGGFGDDVIDGGSGSDTAIYVFAGAVTVDLRISGPQNTGGEGIDTLISIENLRGSAESDTLIGNDEENLLDGYAGADVLIGGRGGDHYFVDDAGDSIIELAGQGIDTVTTAMKSFTLPDNVENLTVMLGSQPGEGFEYVATGNGLANRMYGSHGMSNELWGMGGNDVLVGNSGSDRLIGGDGNDILVGGLLGDERLVNGSFETQDGSNDARQFILAGGDDYNGVFYRMTESLHGWKLSAGTQFELNTYGSNGGFDRGSGNVALDLEATAGESVGIYQDVVPMGSEELLLTFTASRSTGGSHGASPTAVLEVRWNGVVVATIAPTSTAMEQYAFVLRPAWWTGIGVGGADRLEFREVGGGADARGTQLDAVSLRPIQTWTDWGFNFLSGGAGDDWLFGGWNADTFDGGTGADRMYGGRGNDTYHVDRYTDEVIEYADEGIDTIVSTIGWTLAPGSHVENLTLVGAASFGVGNELDNVIIGNALAIC